MPATCAYLAEKMVGLLKQIYLLQWKNAKLKLQSWRATLAELIAPLLFLVIVIVIRQSQDFQQRSPTCRFKPAPLAAKGPMAVLRSFCHLGVCFRDNQTFHTRSGLVDEEGYQNISQTFRLANGWLENPTTQKLVGALFTMPTNWSDPAQSKRIPLASLFHNNASKLFDGVSATPEQKAAFYSAYLPFPRRWHVAVPSKQRFFLSLLTGNELLPSLVCSDLSISSGALKPLCNQSKFRENLKSQFDLTAALAQMSSTAPDKYPITIYFSDYESAQRMLNQMDELNQNGTLRVFSKLWAKTRLLTNGLSTTGGAGTANKLQLLALVSQLLCGPGPTVFTKALYELSVEPGKMPDEPPAAALTPLTGKNDSSDPGVNLTTVVPPEQFCYDKRYQEAIMAGLPAMALRVAGLQGIKNALFGAMPFRPDTPRTRSFLSRVNRTLQEIAQVSYEAEEFASRLASIEEQLSSGSQVATLRTLLSLCHRIHSSESSGRACKSMLDFLASNPPTTANATESTTLTWREVLNVTDVLAKRLYFSTACFRLNKLPGFTSKEAFDNYTKFLIDEFKSYDSVKKPLFIAALVFDAQTDGFVKYRLRFDRKLVDHTLRFKVLDQSFTVAPRIRFPGDFKYFTSLFLHIQELLEHGILSTVTGQEAPLRTYLTMFPTACFMQDKFIHVMGNFISMVLVLSWIYNISRLVNAIVYEKETRLKEMMKIMGLSDGVHWVSWFITSFVLMFIASVLMILLLKVGQLFPESNFLLLLFFLLSYVMCTICEAFFISIFFSSSNVAAAFAGIIYFVGYLPSGVVKLFSGSLSRWQLLLCCLIPQVSLSIGSDFICLWEMANIGLQTSNFYSTPISTGELTFNLVVLMLWVDSAIFLALTWYLEKVFPGAYGVPKPWYFPFLLSFWRGTAETDRSENKALGGNKLAILDSNVSCYSNPQMEKNSFEVDVTDRISERSGTNSDSVSSERSSQYFEEDPTGLQVGIAVRNLTKVYQPGICACSRTAKPFTAVDNLCYYFYEGQVTSFLGHNGAGKSTTMSMLTGLYTPTSGTAYIAGHDIRTEMDAIRKHLGLCPQHNVLFDTLTVEDHIYFYGMLKGLSKEEVAPQIDSFIADVGLQKKRHELCKRLSGGMKRKLSVALAFIGGSKIVLLDEPTAGVDPHARRAIWDVLAKFRHGRTIILTTHHMDEADILGDRICIINKGRLVCSGSPMFLKKVFGEGYTLTLVKASPECEMNRVLSLVQFQVPEACLGECTSSEINIKLPYNSVPSMAALFALLEDKKDQHCISSFGIEDSSLEEIFLTVTGFRKEGGLEIEPDLQSSSVIEFRPSKRDSVRRRHLEQAMGSNAEEASERSEGDPSERDKERLPPATKAQLLRMQVTALWLKRFHVLRRSKLGFIAEFVLPALFILLALALLQIVPSDGENPPMELSPYYLLGRTQRSRLRNLSVFQRRSLSAYPRNVTLTNLASRLMLHMNTTDFLSTRCMKKEVFSNPAFPCRTQYRGSVWSPAPKNLSRDSSTCQCSYDDYPDSVKCVDWPKPARKNLMSGDILESMQGYNLTNYIQSTPTEYYRRRFGGFEFFVNDTPKASASDNVSSEAFRLLGNLVQLQENNGSDGIWLAVQPLLYRLQERKKPKHIANQVWFDNRGYVAAPAYLNTLTNAAMRALANSSLGPPEEIGVSGWTHPFTSQEDLFDRLLFANAVKSTMTVVSIIFALSFIPASFVLFLISERTTNAKQLQFVSGINPALYWLVNHTWNLLNYLVPLTVVILLFVIFRRFEFIGSETVGPFLFAMILFGFASAPLMYPFSWVMSVPSKAFIALSCLNLGIGFITTMSVTILRMIGHENNDQSLLDASEILKAVFLILPHFCLGQSLMELSMYYQITFRLRELQQHLKNEQEWLDKYASKFADYDYKSPWDKTGRYLACLAAQSLVYFGLVVLLEYNCCCKQGLVSSRFFRLCYRADYERSVKQPDAAEIDNDVLAEAAKIEEGRSTDRGGSNSGSGHLLELRRLVKIYSTSSGPRAAVKGISLGVKSHECFGFLGVNGAGKTTTFKMLTGDITPTSGDALISGFSILTEVREVHKQVGYCPQFDALLPLLTGRETLQLYARIRGVQETEIGRVVEAIAKRVGMEAHLDKKTQEYSGGNKRKLSCGIAFIGNPPIVFLDEPTAGMDPGARRFLWRCIQRMVSSGSCVILTTHSMEDCQALCHRLTIMVNGRLQCIGSPQHLKNKFGQGFTIFLRVRQPEASSATSTDALAAVGAETQLERAHDAFMAAFPEAVLCENHASVLQYQLKQSVQLRDIFESVQKLKDSGLVLDYSVNQTTLDQVFINFAKDQTDAAT